MTVWLDAHFNSELALWISNEFDVACRTLSEIDLESASHAIVFQAAKCFPSVVLFTKDADFVAMIELLGSPPQVIWLRCPNLRNIRLQNVLRPRLAEALIRIRSGTPLVQIVIAT